MGFGEDLRLFAAKVEGRARDVFIGTVTAVHGSITEGSIVTAAPGQPVDIGNLLASWQQTFPEDWVGEVATNVVYAPFVEDGFGRAGAQAYGGEREPGLPGGSHSVKLTRASWDRIVETEVHKVTGG